MRYETNVPEGLHLGDSDTDPGAKSGLLFDESNRLVGQATWRPVEDPPPVEEPWADSFVNAHDARTQEQREADAELADRIAELVVTLAVVRAVAAAPRVKRFWSMSLGPRLRALRERLSSIRLPRLTADATSANRVRQLEEVGSVVSSELAAVEPEPALAMTKAEWDARVAAMLAAEAFRDEQFDILRRATVVDPKMIVVGDDPDERLTPRDFVVHVQRALGAAGPAALDDSLYAALVDAALQDEPTTESAKRIGPAER
ncbi:hypothetical protein ACFQ80_20385 [Isoptericola sp. NPDC056578]|uniref:hypothetical protein n=1 Tax=Isoptericola sp. NPDC056578 TaxID=3345870 RepID=UPI0036CA8052